jgi:hypothetical protein
VTFGLACGGVGISEREDDSSPCLKILALEILD